MLDVTFDEDDSRLRDGNAPENMSLLAKLVSARVKKTTEKMRIKNRRRKAGYGNAYHEEVQCSFAGDLMRLPRGRARSKPRRLVLHDHDRFWTIYCERSPVLEQDVHRRAGIQSRRTIECVADLGVGLNAESLVDRGTDIEWCVGRADWLRPDSVRLAYHSSETP